MKEKYNEYQIAIYMAWKKFEELHPKPIRPKWLEEFISIGGTKSQNKNWIVTITLFPKIELKQNQYWERKNQDIRLIEIDKTTGKHFVVLCDGPAKDTIIIFKAEINIIKNLVNILIDADLNKLNKAKYQKRI